VRELAELVAKVNEMERRMANMFRHGPVHSVDTQSQTVRLRLAEGDDGPVLSPPIPYGQQAGALKVHTPPSVGQNMTAFAPQGDMQQAVAMPFTWNNANASPSQSPSENVITYGGATIKLDGSGLSISKGGVTVTISGSGVTITGGQVQHDGKNIGASHTHDGVEPGGGQTGAPT
jgi:phage baseplate assembly protein gpV